MNQIKIIVIEDDDFTRFTLVATLKTNNFNVVAEANNAGLAISRAIEHRPDVALIDLDLGKGPTGIDLSIVLRKNLPNIGIVFLTSYKDPRLLRTSLPELPKGSIFLVKQETNNPDYLTKRILEAANQNNQNTNIDPQIESDFTDSQIETLKLLAEGLSNSEIAKKRFVTEKAVEVTIARLAKKFDIPYDSASNQRVVLAKKVFSMMGKNNEIK
jgi:two-component system, NarL family, nitrate/nitrite response regulator NarL